VQNISANFLSHLLHKKRHFQYAFDDHVSAIHVFTKQTFRAAEKAPLPPPPTMLCRGWDNSGVFYPEAVSLTLALKQ
jgi:hypothetical protein